MDLDIQKMIFEFIGGLGIFLFGIKYMGDGLQNSAGDRLREILDRFTSNPFMGVLAGIIVTILIQSSSGTTVLTVGLVNAGFMTLRQAIGVIMGANIGTTVTAFIIGIEIKEYALPILAVGALLLFFFNSKKIKYIGQVFFGFGALFYGLDLMGSGMKPLRSLEAFQQLTIDMSNNPILGVVVGTLFTVIVQSSSATIGILQELYSQGTVTLGAALPVLFGDNIGTTITAVLAAIGASVAARRAALTHVIFNLLGTAIFLLLLVPFTSYVEYLAEALDLNNKMQIAFAHGSFNFANTAIQFPFIGLLAYIVTKLVPGDDVEIEYKAKHLDPIFLERSPAVALGQAKLEVLRMADYAKKGLHETFTYLDTKSKKNAEKAAQYEEAINNLDQRITDYLVQLSSYTLSAQDSEQHSILMDSVRDIERIGDHMENIVELVDYQMTHKVDLSETALKDLNEMFELTMSTIDEAFHAMDENDKEKARKVVDMENKIDKMERTLRKQHILRLNEGKCTGASGIVFVDIISNLERIGDHATNIAEYVLGEEE
ncbi:Na/Pi cotransporter family protein [Pseudalkalibacillus berkeleyi]|uniref:Na/Pi cotransporter family protein n=1 Tax=Pseudalkalibacillus berkeleyi TaxID=1069813 RepID=A0ABS9H253_9BACL|nr:Na/Pi cotransporter family protein [Pseudalkalibacillus berkeleyi]MCF6137928.1 Na/Pi cotransporter family protein [Pseudalkalibacillus berkeleyi]